MLSDPAPPAEPAHRLPPAALTLWRLQGAASALAAAVVATTIGGAVGGAVAMAAVVAALVWGVLAIGIVPILRHRRWRYEVREQEIDIRHGAITVTRTVVPMRRVQHVETRRGLLEQGRGLSTVVFHTAAGETQIPALTVAASDAVRTRIAQLARTADEL